MNKKMNLILATIGATITSLSVAEEATVTIAIVDDVSGKELKEQHGIEPAELDDVQAIANVIFDARVPGTIAYDAIDEDGSDNAPLIFHVSRFEAPVPKPPVLRGLTVREKQKAIAKFKADTTDYLQKHSTWKSKVLEGADRWVDSAVERRLGVEADFLRLLQERQRDFRRSDIMGTIEKIAVQCRASKRSFLILNSDLNHQPGPNAKPQKPSPIDAAVLPPQVTIVLVNTSRLPNNSPILEGIRNKILHANSLQEAAQLIRTELKPPASPRN